MSKTAVLVKKRWRSKAGRSATAGGARATSRTFLVVPHWLASPSLSPHRPGEASPPELPVFFPDGSPSFYPHSVTMASFANPTQIFADDVIEEKGENARLSAFVGAIAVGDLVKSTLGPKGMDKILQSASTGDILVTNDGATILKSIALDNAAAKVLVNISKVQDDEVGDGTTSVTVLAAELLREAEKLVNRKIHPQTIIEGYRIASKAALEALEKAAVDRSADMESFRKDLHAIARTTLSSKVLAQDRDQFAALACDAVLRLRGSTDLSHIQIIKKAGGKLSDSYLDEGFILDKKIGVNQPKRLENAKILVANTAMDTDKVKIFGARVKVESTGKLADLEKAEREKMKAKVERIKAHGINCFVNRQLIYNWPEQLFTEAGIMSIEHADFDGVERLALVTGGEIASTFDHPDQVKLGQCDVIEEVIIGEDTLIKFSGVAAGQACTIVLRGATEQLLDEAERSLHDALAVLSQTVKDPRVTLGGGCAEMVMSKAVEQAAQNTTGKKQLAVDAFAYALKQLPTILADNAGLDSSDLVTRLRQAINNGMTSSGLDLLTPGGGIADMRELGVVESYKLKKAVVSSASEAAERPVKYSAGRSMGHAPARTGQSGCPAASHCAFGGPPRHHKQLLDPEAKAPKFSDSSSQGPTDSAPD
ncbi:T-complex protein 1 subunit beta [Aspergillus luchuensis]|uniref:CCT-beta n=1 Tax=Aspergillus kawachii TaxID=1069201 RepID=A0A146FNJ2_ASPKA|nr:T-complex protein 1 subunit beta [Aspergillus luchuensis]